MKIFFTLFFFLLCHSDLVCSLEILHKQPSEKIKPSQRLIPSMAVYNNAVIGVGTIGHIITWRSNNKWQQLSSPTSVTLTDVTNVNDNQLFAVGHSGAIVKCTTACEKWSMSLDGYALIEMKKH